MQSLTAATVAMQRLRDRPEIGLDDGEDERGGHADQHADRPAFHAGFRLRMATRRGGAKILRRSAPRCYRDRVPANTDKFCRPPHPPRIQARLQATSATVRGNLLARGCCRMFLGGLQPDHVSGQWSAAGIVGVLDIVPAPTIRQSCGRNNGVGPDTPRIRPVYASCGRRLVFDVYGPLQRARAAMTEAANREGIRTTTICVVESTGPLRRRRSTCAPSPPLPRSLSCRVQSRTHRRLSGAPIPRLPA